MQILNVINMLDAEVCLRHCPKELGLDSRVEMLPFALILGDWNEICTSVKVRVHRNPFLIERQLARVEVETVLMSDRHIAKNIWLMVKKKDSMRSHSST